MAEAHVSLRTYVLVYLSLMALLAATVISARLFTGPLEILASLVISVIKTLLILTFFMHLRQAERITLWAAGAGYVWVAILFLLSFADYLTRVMVEVR